MIGNISRPDLIDRVKESGCSYNRSVMIGKVGDSSASFYDPTLRMTDLRPIGSVCSVCSQMDRKLFVHCYDSHHDQYGSGTFCHERRPIKVFLVFFWPIGGWIVVRPDMCERGITVSIHCNMASIIRDKLHDYITNVFRVTKLILLKI